MLDLSQVISFDRVYLNNILYSFLLRMRLYRPIEAVLLSILSVLLAVALIFLVMIFSLFFAKLCAYEPFLEVSGYEKFYLHLSPIKRG